MDEYAKLIEDRDMLEMEVEHLNHELLILERMGINEGNKQYDYIYRELNATSNELMYIETCLEDYASE
jgi:hypothetical protein